MSDTSVAIAIATIVSTAISAAAAYLTQRSSRQSNAEVAQIETRGDIEKNAFDKAERFLSKTVERQDSEIEELTTKVRTAEAAAQSCQVALLDMQVQVTDYKRKGRRLARAVYQLRQELSGMGIETPSDQTLQDALIEFLNDNN